MTVLWDVMPPEVRKAAEKYVKKHSDLVPTWCHCLTLMYEVEGDENAVAACCAEFHYRQATIRLFPSFLDETEADRELTIVHELLHIPLDPLVSYARSVAERISDEHIRAHVLDELTCRMEGTVVDLSFAITAKRTRHAPVAS